MLQHGREPACHPNGMLQHAPRARPSARSGAVGADGLDGGLLARAAGAAAPLPDAQGRHVLLPAAGLVPPHGGGTGQPARRQWHHPPAGSRPETPARRARTPASSRSRGSRRGRSRRPSRRSRPPRAGGAPPGGRPVGEAVLAGLTRVTRLDSTHASGRCVRWRRLVCDDGALCPPPRHFSNTARRAARVDRTSVTRTVAGRSGYRLGRVGRWMSYHRAARGRRRARPGPRGERHGAAPRRGRARRPRSARGPSHRGDQTTLGSCREDTTGARGACAQTRARSRASAPSRTNKNNGNAHANATIMPSAT